MKTTLAFFILLLLLIGKFSFAQLVLIPQPKRSELNEGEFRITPETRIHFSDTNEFLFDELNDCLKTELGFTLLEGSKRTVNCIAFELLSDPKQRERYFEKHGLDAKFEAGEEGYALKISEQGIEIAAATEAGLFYGLQTLRQLIIANRNGDSIPCVTIYDYPDIAVRGWQDDISRGPIPKMETLKEEIRKLSSFKLNYFTLYIEHVFKFKSHPEIAPEDGITEEQVEELSRFAEKYHVKLIGSYQSFGHMEKTLSHPKYRHLAENSHIISPVLEESYEFLGDVYSEIVPAFSGEYFNINCDETFGLGEGKSKALVDSIGIDGVYLQHINRLNELLVPYGKKNLMWGDIVTKYPGIVKNLPRNITVMAWAYHAAESLEYAVIPLAETGLNFWVAPGINCWGNMFPNFYETKVNVYNFIRDGYKNGATGVINTSWDDDGLNFFQNNWHGFVWGAENSWNAPATNLSLQESDRLREELYEAFNTRYNAIFYGVKDHRLIDDMLTFSAFHQSSVREIERNGRLFERVFPIHADYVKKGKQQENLRLLLDLNGMMDRSEQAKTKVRYNSETLDYLLFAMKEVEFSLEKNLLRIDLSSYLVGDTGQTVGALQEKIQKLIGETKSLKQQYAALWARESRPWWLEKNLKKFDVLEKSLEELKYHCIILPSDTISDAGRKISIRSLFGDLPVYYSVNSDTVTDASEKYTGPFYVKEDADIKARVITEEGSFETFETSLLCHKAIGKLHQLNTEYSAYHPAYDGGGKLGLLDGRVGDDKDLRSGRWQGYGGEDINIEIDLEKVEPVKRISMGFFQNTESWVIFPRQIEIFVKDREGADYERVQSIINHIAPEEKGNIRHVYSADFKNLETRFIKIVAKNYGKLPEWHHAGSSYDAMLFSDEIIVE